MSPSISICIPAYNAARLLPETLASVKSQTFTDWELIVVEDGSDDGTRQIVRDFSESIERSVIYLRHDTNKGLPATRNTGIKTAKGKWIALLDADDLWAPEHLQLLVAATPKDPSLVHSVSLIFEDDVQVITQKRTPPETGTPGDTLFKGDYIIQPSSTLLHKKLLEKVGPFDESIEGGYAEDLDYWLRIASQGYPILCNKAETCFYRKHTSALTAKGARATKGSARVRLKHLYAPVLTQPLRNQVTASYLASAARMHLRSEPAIAKDLYQDSIKLVPTRLDRVVLYMISWILSKA